MILTIAIGVAVGLLLARLLPALAKYVAIIVVLTVLYVLLEGRWQYVGPPLGVLVWYLVLYRLVGAMPDNLFRGVPRLSALIKPVDNQFSPLGHLTMFGLAVATAPLAAAVVYAIGWLVAKAITPN